MKFGRRTRRDDVSLELTPLIDVMFLLLIFFLVTASFTRDETAAIPLDLPGGQSGEERTPGERLEILVRPNGEVLVSVPGEDQPRVLPGDDLEPGLSALRAQFSSLPVHLRGDEAVRYGRIMEVLDVCRSVGFQRVFNVVRSGADD